MRTLLAVLICASIVSGCASSGGEEAPSAQSTEQTSSEAAKPTAATIAWVDGECVVEAALRENPLPPTIGEPPTEVDRPAVVAFLTAARDRFHAARTILDGLGTAPVPEGESLVAAQREVVGEMVGTLDESVEYAIIFPAPEFGAPFRLAANALNHFSVGDTSLGDVGDLGDLTRKYPALGEAYGKAPRC